MLSWLAAEDLKLKLFGNTSHSAVLHFSSLKAAMIFVSVTGSTYGLGNSLKSIWHAMSDYSFEKAKAIVRLFKDPQKAPRDFRLGLLLWNSSWTRWLCSREPRGRQTCEGSTALFFWGVFGVWILTMRLHFDLSQGFEKQWNLVDHRGHERPFPCTGPAAESVSCWVFFFFFFVVVYLCTFFPPRCDILNFEMKLETLVMYWGMLLTIEEMFVSFQVSAREPHPLSHQEFLLWTQNAGAPVSFFHFFPPSISPCNTHYGLN